MKIVVVLCILGLFLFCEGQPAEFDAREKWNCRYPSLDMYLCSGDYACAAAAALSYRFCISESGNNIYFSPENIISCMFGSLLKGCEGGTLTEAFEYILSDGIVDLGCLSFNNWLVPNHLTSGYYYTTEPCPTECYNPNEEMIKYQITGYEYVVPSSAEDIITLKNEIYNNGPVAMMMNNYSDFATFSGDGIYSPGSSASISGYRSVVIVGWGADYWICQNSQGTLYGNMGFVKIAMGTTNIVTDGEGYAYPTGWKYYSKCYSNRCMDCLSKKEYGCKQCKLADDWLLMPISMAYYPPRGKCVGSCTGPRISSMKVCFEGDECPNGMTLDSSTLECTNSYSCANDSDCNDCDDSNELSSLICGGCTSGRIMLDKLTAKTCVQPLLTVATDCCVTTCPSGYYNAIGRCVPNA